MELKMNAGLNPRKPVSQPVPSAPAQAQEPVDSPKTAQERRQQAREDRVELSRQAVEFLQGRKEEEEAPADEPMTPAEKRQQAKEDKLKAARQMISVMQQQSVQMKEQSEQQAEALKKAMDKMKRCAKIARNIGKGHKVPPQDEKYLLENDPKAYMMAMALRMLEDEKRKVKSELKDEEERQETENSPAGGVEGVDSAGEAADVPEISVEGGAAE